MSRTLEPFTADFEDDMDENDLPDDSTLDITIVRGEDDVVTGFKGDPDLVPDYVGDRPAALVTGRNGFEFETPVWAYADTFMELEEAGLLTLAGTLPVTFGPHQVYIYETA